MESQITRICKLTKRVGNKQVMLFTQIMRQHLLGAGIDQQALEKALKNAVKQFRKEQTFDADCVAELSTMENQSNAKAHRGIDSMGRILVEYCFCRTPETKLIWPDKSEKDTEARISFIEGVIPRPLIRYFLVTVRGTIPNLNKFEAASILFGEENVAHEERKEFVDKLVKEFGGNDSADSKWEAIYNDPRFQSIALELIGDIRRKLEHFGLERYLKILENLRQRDPEKKSLNEMQRPFYLADAKQLDEALWAAERNLAQSLE